MNPGCQHLRGMPVNSRSNLTRRSHHNIVVDAVFCRSPLLSSFEVRLCCGRRARCVQRARLRASSAEPPPSNILFWVPPAPQPERGHASDRGSATLKNIMRLAVSIRLASRALLRRARRGASSAERPRLSSSLRFCSRRSLRVYTRWRTAGPQPSRTPLLHGGSPSSPLPARAGQLS